MVVIDGPQKGEKVRTLKNRADSIFLTNFPVRIKNQHYDAKGNWYAGEKVCLRRATPEEIEAAKKPKPLRRGDLVLYREQIGIVHNIDSDGYWVAALTGDGCCVHKNDKDLMRIGSIRKKIKRIKKEMEGGK